MRAVSLLPLLRPDPIYKPRSLDGQGQLQPCSVNY